MKKELLFFFLIFTITLFAQSSEQHITIIDVETNLPIPDATVFIIKTKQTLVSNAEGEVTFSLGSVSNIQISHPSYLNSMIRSSTLKSDYNFVYLNKKISALDEIIVTKKHPQKILKGLVQNSIKELSRKVRLKVYTREFFKLNGVYTSYNDGLLNFQIFEDNKNFVANMFVEQNRSFGLVQEELSSDVLGYNLNDIMENYYNFKYLNPILEPNAKEDYEFVIKGYPPNDRYNLMIVSPNENLKGLKDEYTILYDSKEKLIIETNSSLSPISLSNSKEKTAIGAKNIYKSFFKTIYRNDGSKYFLLSSREEIGFERVDKGKKTEIEVRNYFVTSDCTHQIIDVKPNNIFKDKTLYNKKNLILTNYWKTSGLQATDEEKKIISNIQFRE